MSLVGGRGMSSSSDPSIDIPKRFFLLIPTPPPSSTIQCTDFAKSKSLTSPPFSEGCGTVSGRWIRVKMSISKSTLTNGPLKHAGGGSRVHSCAATGGCGNEPPAKYHTERFQIVEKVYSCCTSNG